MSGAQTPSPLIRPADPIFGGAVRGESQNQRGDDWAFAITICLGFSFGQYAYTDWLSPMEKILLFLAAWIGFNIANAEQLDIKGVRPGMNLEEIKTLYPQTTCVSWTTSESDTACQLSGFMTYATVRGELQAFLVDGKVTLVWVTIDSKNFDDVVLALREKYGKPFLSYVDKAQNLYGATFINRTITWVAGGYALSAKKYAEKISESSIALRTSDHANQTKKRIKDGLKEKAKDL